MPSDAAALAPFDDELAASYVGKYILVGLTFLDPYGQECRQQQLHGVIQSASRDGILIDLRGAHAGQTWNMPPALDAIRPAEPGCYTLHETDEIVDDPDLLASWTIRKPATQH
ncbi:MAG TPA: hypothetical protein VE914_21840 [Candidatus Angelobacter sp.]|nr:hypothetical protein [Candidatus Angelobacter sp.]